MKISTFFLLVASLITILSESARADYYSRRTVTKCSNQGENAAVGAGIGAVVGAISVMDVEAPLLVALLLADFSV